MHKEASLAFWELCITKSLHIYCRTHKDCCQLEGKKT